MRQIVVTGGGTGIGLAVAVEFVRAGDSVTITGRREHVLKGGRRKARDRGRVFDRGGGIRVLRRQ